MDCICPKDENVSQNGRLQGLLFVKMNKYNRYVLCSFLRCIRKISRLGYATN